MSASALYAAEQAFFARWTLPALAFIDPELHGRILEQQSLVKGATDDDRADQEAAMCRGWAAAVKTMEEAEAPKGALFGEDPAENVVVVISDQPGASVEAHGRRVLHVTPDAVARMVAASMRLSGLFQ